MNGLLELILNNQNGAAIKELAKNFGVSNDDAMKALGSMLPSLTRGVKTNVSEQSGLDGLIGALGKGNHQRYLDEPNRLGQKETISDGNRILGHILGSKDVSRQVASEAAASTGLNSDLLKKMLPVIATMLMGSLGKKTSSMELSGQNMQASGTSGMTGMLGSLLDSDNDGSVVDDLIGMARRFM